MYDTKAIKFRRGQVWVCDDPLTAAKIQSRSHIMAKRRPYIIMTSNNILEKFDNEVINVYPLTTTVNKLDLPRTLEHDIIFRNEFGVLNRIVTNQIMTIDKTWFDQYLYTLPDDFMEWIDQVLSYKLGLTDTVEKSTKNIVKQLTTFMERENSNNEIIKHKVPKIRWTTKMAIEFIQLYKKNDFDTIRSRFGQLDEYQIYRRYYYLKRKINVGGCNT